MSDNNFDWRSLVAEAMATFGLVFVTSMASLHRDAKNLTLIGESIVTFLILSLMVYFSYEISGAHINPAVTFSFLLTKRIDFMSSIFYMISQLLGSTIAAILLQVVVSSDILETAAGKSELGFPHIGPDITPFQGVIMEIILTFLLVFVIWIVAVDSRAPDHIYGLGIGGIVGVNILIGASISGAAMNPARVFGPAIVSLDFTHHWIYWVGPIIGAIFASFFYRTVFLDDTNSEYQL